MISIFWEKITGLPILCYTFRLPHPHLVVSVVVDAELKVSELLHLAEVARLRSAPHLGAALVSVAGASADLRGLFTSSILGRFH